VIKSEEIMVQQPSTVFELRLVRSHVRFCETDEPEKLMFSSMHYSIGGFGSGATPQIADAQGGRGGVGISSPLPCIDAEQLGSVAGLHVIQLPVKVSLLG
jgi:hypothetical protein